LILIVGFALAIRLYLSLTSYCMSGDGVAYLTMARQFASGDIGAALKSVFSPLYPSIIAVFHLAIPNWEMAGNLVSVLMGTAAVASIYALTQEAFNRRDIALGAAALTAIHPAIAAYSASVRTEAGYIFLTTGGAALILRGLRTRLLRVNAYGGATLGLAYLYRTEAIGMPIVAAIAIVAGAIIWRQYEMKWALAAATIMAGGFLLVASPYLLYLHANVGHWTVGREFNAAMMYGMGDVAQNPQEWRREGYSSNASPLASALAHPQLYSQKVVADLGASAYGFVQALGPLLTVFLVAGLWWRGRSLIKSFPEAFLAGIVLFYFFGFALSYTGARFMVHLAPFTFGWVALGIMAASAEASRLTALAGWRLPPVIIPLTVALVLLPQTLWPIGYDMRGIRYAGEAVAKVRAKPGDLVAVDGRAAWYAGAQFVPMPERVPDLCEWLGNQKNAHYMVLNDRDEYRYRVSSDLTCVQLLRRYPRGNSGHYDLFAIALSDKAKP
jgi:dolichyl-phosphate-mannose-protein mannosyltransferase